MSYNTLMSCTYRGDESLIVVDAKAIIAVVAMVPHSPFPEDTTDRYFVVEKPGLDVAYLGGNVENVPDEDN
jgi:hypothetical protein